MVTEVGADAPPPALIGAALMRAAAEVPTPAVLYDLDAITRGVVALRADLSVIGDVRLCFAVKANRCPAVLGHLASLGLGADVASSVEHDAALAAGMGFLTSTSPALTAEELAAMHRTGVAVDVSGVSQLRALAPLIGRGAEIGLRVRVPVSPADRSGAGVAWSRFGVDPADPEVHDLITANGLRVTRLHAHAGEIGTARRARQLVGALLSCAAAFGSVTTLNLGGGFAALYAHPGEPRRAWACVTGALRGFAAEHGRRFTTIVEPGLVLTALAGFLVTTVRAVDPHPTGRAVATVDASAWNLLTWSAPRLIAQLPHRPGPTAAYAIAGASCYEEDYVTRATTGAPIRVGDRLVFSAAGAYVTSMARAMHGLPAPVEVTIPPSASGRPETVAITPQGGNR